MRRPYDAQQGHVGSGNMKLGYGRRSMIQEWECILFAVELRVHRTLEPAQAVQLPGESPQDR